MSRDHYKKSEKYSKSLFSDKFDLLKNGIVAINDLQSYLNELLLLDKEDVIYKLIEDSGLPKMKIYKRMGVDSHTISGWINKLQPAIPSFENIIKFCIVLNLAPEISKYLLKRYNYRFNDEVVNLFYKSLVETHYNLPIQEINQLLKISNIQEWGND